MNFLWAQREGATPLVVTACPGKVLLAQVQFTGWISGGVHHHTYLFAYFMPSSSPGANFRSGLWMVLEEADRVVMRAFLPDLVISTM